MRRINETTWAFSQRGLIQSSHYCGYLQQDQRKPMDSLHFSPLKAYIQSIASRVMAYLMNTAIKSTC
jgi:hypothetical protein